MWAVVVITGWSPRRDPHVTSRSVVLPVMGSAPSSFQSLATNQQLLHLVSKTHVTASDPEAWNLLLSGSPDLTGTNAKMFEDSLTPLMERMLQNNPSSHNISSLVSLFEDKCQKLRSLEGKDDRLHAAQAEARIVALALRISLRYLIQTLTEENVINHLTPDPSDESFATSNAVLERLILTAFEVLIDMPMSNRHYFLDTEAASILLILLSVQMYSVRPAQKSLIYRTIMSKKFTIHSLLLMKVLLNNFAKQEAPPSDYQSGSIIIGLASGLWNVLSLGYGKADDVPPDAILARLSLFLILVLTNHCTSESNSYREAVFSCMDTKAGAEEPVSGFRIDFQSVFQVFCDIPSDDPTTLLLYILLHKNQYFRNYVISRATDLDLIIVPILRILYDCPERSSHHVYMALIILLILSEDTLFNEAVHDNIVRQVPWYKEKVLTDVSLGCLLILVIIRAIQFNISRTRDKFLHTNLLATLANMSSSFKRVSPYVCEKLVSLFRRLVKRFTRALSTSNQVHNGHAGADQSDRVSEADTDVASTAMDAAAHDLSIYEEVLRMLLEIINSCLASQMIHNPNLIYTLLYNCSIFEPFQSNPSFQDVLTNIELVISYFTNQIKMQSKEETPSVVEVYRIIEESSKKWTSEKLKNFPPLKFKYVEDDQPEEFFIPYIWALVYRSSGIFFTSQNILLFNPNRNVV